MDAAQERALNQAHDARLVHLNEQLIFPLISKKQAELVVTLCEEFKHKGHVNPNNVALLAAYRDLGIELAAIARRGESAVVQMHAYKQE